MTLIKLITGEEFILDENYAVGFDPASNLTIKIDVDNLHRVYHRYAELSEAYKEQFGIEEIPNHNNKVIEYGFTPMNTDPHPFENIEIIKENIVYLGKIKESSGLYKTFTNYKNVMVNQNG